MALTATSTTGAVPTMRRPVLGWGLHALLGLCVVLLYLAIRADSGGDGDSRPR